MEQKKARRKRRFRVIGILVVLLVCAECVAFYAWDQSQIKRTDPAVLFGQYIEKLQQGKYDEMYEMLSTSSKEQIKKEAFIDRHKKIYDGIEMTNMQATINKHVEKEAGKMIVSYKMSFDTLAGTVSFDNQAAYVQDGRENALKWKDSLIFPKLTATDKIKVSTTKASRGSIKDRNDKELATEGMAVSVGVKPGKLKANKDKSVKKIAKLLNIKEDVINNKLSAKWVNDDSFVPLKTIKKVDEGNLVLAKPDKENVENSKLQDELLQITGVMITDVSVRQYPLGETASHLVGYVQKVTDADIKQHKNEGYTDDCVIGKSGVEAAFEKELKGQNGVEIKIMDEKGGRKDVIATKEKQDGKDIKLTIDSEMQKRLYEEYKQDKSCSVAMNPYTGEVLALVSTPSFDANEIIRGISQEAWDKLDKDKNKPMYNRFRQCLCPGSSFKPVVAAVGLDCNKLDPNEDFKDSGKAWQKDKSWGRYYITTLHTYKPVILKNAIIYSDNIYFAKAALKIGKKEFQKGLDRIGFGKEMPFEVAISKSQYTNDKEIGSEIQLADSGYGQGQVLVNPVHMASIYSSFLNEGNMVKPYLTYKDKPKAEYYVKGAFKKEDAAFVVDAMKDVVNDPHGTAYDAHRSDIVLAGKTGTAEIKQTKEDKKGTELGWFSVMTTDKNTSKPIYLLTMVEDVKGRGGSTYVVKKSSKILQDYLK